MSHCVLYLYLHLLFCGDDRSGSDAQDRRDIAEAVCEITHCQGLGSARKTFCMARFCASDDAIAEGDPESFHTQSILELVECARIYCGRLEGALFRICLLEQCILFGEGSERAGKTTRKPAVKYRNEETFWGIKDGLDAVQERLMERETVNHGIVKGDPVGDIAALYPSSASSCQALCHAHFSPLSPHYSTCVLARCVRSRDANSDLDLVSKLDLGSPTKRFTNAELDFCATKCGKHGDSLRRACYKGCKDNFRK